MTPIKIVLWGFLAAISGLWLLAEPIFSIPQQFAPIRAALINYTGIIGISVMSLAMILAVRPVFAERWFDGLDKMYRLHKWLGFSALIFAVSHWISAKAPHWLIDLGLMERRGRGPRPEITDPIALFFRERRGLAEDLGEWAFYAAVFLIALALIKRFPYRLFHKTHILLAVAYLVLVFHAVVLMKFSYWGDAVGIATGILMAAGTVSAIVLLAKTSGLARPVVGQIENVEYNAPNHVLKVDVKLASRWPGHDAGQFAFVTFDDAEGAHPFTISSSWQRDGRLTFLIKELGDYTRTLPGTLAAGQKVKVEGPFGRFDFQSEKERQVWIAGGIGISPFIARMQALASDRISTDVNSTKPVDLFYATAADNLAEFLPRIQERAEAAGVNLHVIRSPRDGLLRAKDIMGAIPKWRDADLWFCGPEGFGKSLRQDFVAAGLPTTDFHQEYFQMR
ncbi:MAG: ferric reductase-like transmembrane domain-containing protein [Hyphomicrobium sp.]